MEKITAQDIYVPLSSTRWQENQDIVEEFAPLGVRFSVTRPALAIRGLSILPRIGTSSHKDVMIDANELDIPSYTQDYFSALKELPSVGFVTVAAGDSKRSLQNAAQFNDGLQVVMKGIDVDHRAEDYQQVHGRTISEQTLSFCALANELSINYMMVAGQDVGCLEDLEGAFVTGIRPEENIPELADTKDHPDMRTIDPRRVLEIAKVPVKFVVGRKLIGAKDKSVAVEAFLELTNKG